MKIVKEFRESILLRAPTVGILALAAGLLGQWLRHAAFPLTEGLLGENYYYGLLAIGGLGALLVWIGLRKSELTATLMGYLGGLFIWIGWFEFGFHYFAEHFAVPPYAASERLISTPDLNLVQASFPILFSLFLVYGVFNRHTRCNFMRWIHRNLRVSPGTPTAKVQRDIARITAMETLFVVWFCYTLWLFITYFGASMRIIGGAYLLWLGWFLYLLVKLLKINRPGYAFRYGIPVGIIGWVLVATPSHMGLFPVIWLKPFEYPVASVTALLVFGLSLYVLGGLGRFGEEANAPVPAD